MAYNNRNAPHVTKRLDERDVRRILAALEKPKLSGFDRRTYRGRRDAALVRLLVLTGMRISEVCNLRRHDLTPIEVDGIPCMQLRFTGKGGKVRKVTLANGKREFLEGYLARHPGSKAPEAPLFLQTRKNGEPIPDQPVHRLVVNRVLVRLGERLGIPGLHPHRFRHTLASRYAERGCDTFRLLSWFGWSSAQSAARYVSLSDSVQVRMSEELSW